MDSLPLEVMVHICSSLRFNDKHVMRNMNHLCKAAADHAIRKKQKRLTIVPDDEADPGMLSSYSCVPLNIIVI
jgi:hypothetical protein